MCISISEKDRRNGRTEADLEKPLDSHIPRKVPALKEAGGSLSNKWAVELASIVAWCTSKLVVLRGVNDRCLERMEVPAEFTESLPKHAKALNIGDALRKALEKQCSSKVRGRERACTCLSLLGL